MQVAWVAPNGCTPPLVLKACVALPSLLMGPRVHEWSAFGSFDGLLSNEENEYGTALDCSCDLEFLEQGKIVHGFMIKLGLELESDLLISLTAVCCHAECHDCGIWIAWSGPEAITLYQAMKQASVQPIDATFVLAACNHSVGEYAADRLFSLDPHNIGVIFSCQISMLSLACGIVLQRYGVLMREKRLTKDLGYSRIEINEKLQAFGR
ncbi:pentatricopeptide repeat-containing protein [Citrus sinensis]|nr:pentatricopeptide repeat-containing protein [Citrus sinensis]